MRPERGESAPARRGLGDAETPRAVPNVDAEVVAGFGEEWERFDQQALAEEDHLKIATDYFGLFPFDRLSSSAVGMDVGCGSGRWARFVAPRVGRLICFDASERAVAVASRNLQGFPNVEVKKASVESLPVEDESLDFAYSLGVLHHLPDTARGIASVAAKLKSGAPFLLYLYYDFENRPRFYRQLWLASEVVRRRVCHAPGPLRFLVSDALAALVYWPLARGARLAELLDLDTSGWPLSYYRDKGFYVMRTDALDRFGTRLERRFSKLEIREMLESAGFDTPTFSERAPFWVALSYKR